jgi:hypothetical protein
MRFNACPATSSSRTRLRGRAGDAAELQPLDAFGEGDEAGDGAREAATDEPGRPDGEREKEQADPGDPEQPFDLPRRGFRREHGAHRPGLLAVTGERAIDVDEVGLAVHGLLEFDDLPSVTRLEAEMQDLSVGAPDRREHGIAEGRHRHERLGARASPFSVHETGMGEDVVAPVEHESGLVRRRELGHEPRKVRRHQSRHDRADKASVATHGQAEGDDGLLEGLAPHGLAPAAPGAVAELPNHVEKLGTLRPILPVDRIVAAFHPNDLQDRRR